MNKNIDEFQIKRTSNKGSDAETIHKNIIQIFATGEQFGDHI